MSQLWKQRAWQYICQHRVVSIIVGHVVVMTVLSVVLLNNAFGLPLFGAFAQSSCASGSQLYTVASGDTLGGIAARYNTTWESLASYNKIANPNTIYVSQHICIPGHTASTSAALSLAKAVRGQTDVFPYGQCTWWANERYYQLHGVFVPWTSNADAWEWTARASDFHWNISSQPSVGSIIDLQPWVEGAYGLGHVAVVERVLGGGHVIASNMNWGGSGSQVVDVEFSAGPGVTFISL